MLTGTSDFADLDEPAVAVLDVAPLAPPPPAAMTLEPLPRIRLAEPFEQLRDASDRMLAQTGARPKIFLANLGVPADFSPRANFARNFFAAGGIAAVTNDGFAPLIASPPRTAKTDLAALVAASRTPAPRSPACAASDETYGREAVAAARGPDGGRRAASLLCGTPGR